MAAAAKPLTVGDRIDLWCARTPDGKARVLSIRPYTGKFINAFNIFVTCEVCDFNGKPKGSIEMAYEDPVLRAEAAGKEVAAMDYINAANGPLKMDVPRVTGELQKTQKAAVPEAWDLL